MISYIALLLQLFIGIWAFSVSNHALAVIMGLIMIWSIWSDWETFSKYFRCQP